MGGGLLNILNILIFNMPPQIKSKEKVDSLCLFSQEVYNKVLTEVPKYKLISTYILADRFNINGSLARAVINDLVKKDLIKPVDIHNNQRLYTRVNDPTTKNNQNDHI